MAAAPKKAAKINAPERNGASAKKPVRVLNLNAARLARAEVEQEPVLLEIGAETFTLPAEMPWDFARLIQREDLDGAILSLLDGDKDVETRFYAQKLSYDDIKTLVEGVMELYGVGEGK